MKVDKGRFPYILIVSLIAFFVVGILLGFAPSR